MIMMLCMNFFRCLCGTKLQLMKTKQILNLFQPRTTESRYILLGFNMRNYKNINEKNCLYNV